MSLRENHLSWSLRSNLVFVLLLALLTPTLIFAQAKEPPKEQPKKDKNFHIANMTNLGIKALKELSAGEKNAVVCPLLLYNSLSLLLLGAEGNTAKEIEGVLGFKKTELEEYSKLCNNILGSYSIRKALSYEMAFHNPESVAPKKEYQDLSAKYFKMIFSSMPDIFIKPNEPWLRFTVDSSAALSLNWAKTFDVKLTHQRNFSRLNGTIKPTVFMQETDDQWYYSDKLIQAVIKHYEYRNFCFIIMVPRQKKDINTLQNLTYNDIRYLMKYQDLRDGRFEMPKIRLDLQNNMNSVLQKMGMKDSYKQLQADFSSMWLFPAYIENIKSNIELEINEEKTNVKNDMGVEGATLGGAMGEGPFKVIADHPFMFVIYNEEFNLPLFIGVIYDP
jgi:serine protease inhibitor